MNEDTSSSPRQEWYEADYEPDEPKVQTLQGMNLRITPPNTPKPGQPHFGPNGDLIGIVQHIDLATGQMTVATTGYVTRARRAGKTIHAIIEASAKAYVEAAKKILDALPKQSDFVETAPESVRDRALRLAKEPHSMAQDSSAFHFDVRGRRRY